MAGMASSTFPHGQRSRGDCGMKRTIGLIAGLFLILGLIGLTTQSASADDPLTLNWASEVNAAQCEGGKLVINVTHKVINGRDSGEAGNYWAYGNYDRQIQVWDRGDGTFCAIGRYIGLIETVAGRSPGDTDDIAAGITGSFQGGFRMIVTGTLRASPDNKSKGNIGTFDHNWNGVDATGLAEWNWIGSYFEAGYARAYEFWGWIYRAGDNGTWINAGSGNQGDITD
jgi:hypothetical protein